MRGLPQLNEFTWDIVQRIVPGKMKRNREGAEPIIRNTVCLAEVLTHSLGDMAHPAPAMDGARR